MKLPFILLFVTALFAQGGLFKIRISNLRLSEDDSALLEKNLRPIRWQGTRQSALPIPRFDAFAFVVPDLEEREGRLELAVRQRGGEPVSSGWLVLELKKGAGRRGFLDVWNWEKEKWVPVSCEIDAARLKACDKKESRQLLEWHDRHRLEVGSRGGLWYRGRSGAGGENGNRRDFGQTFTTLSGGRALAENLALDRDLILGRGEKDEEVLLSEIKGVTVESIPWEDWLPEGEIEVDVLAMRVPEDQHLMVVPGLKSLFELMERIEEAGAPFLQSLANGGEYRGLPGRYRSQMGLDLPDALARLMPVKSVAVTGGDPFFPTGSDVAVILETDKVDFVYGTLKRTLEAKAKRAGAKSVVDGNGFGFENGDRSFSSHLLKLKDAVVVSNSRQQVARLREVADGKVAALGASEEYRFFRHRYPMVENESAYLFISDACLRRWSGPEVRIGASRRSRALSALAKVTAGDLLGEGVSQEFQPLLGQTKAVDGLIVSENYGSLGFVTPIGELGIETVTAMEREGYDQWRRGYENGWARFFDPIAIQLKLGKEREEMEMTILPLRVDSDYDELISLVGNATLSKAAAEVPGESVFHFAMAVDKESDLVQGLAVELMDSFPSLSVNPLGWMGESLSVTLGDSLLWSGKIGEESLEEMPALLRVEVESRVKLALFMTALKGMIESVSPGLVDWETRKHGERKYVVMTGDEDDIGAPVSIYYATLPSALLLSLNEEMLKRAIDREAKLAKNGKAEDQVMVQTTPKFLSTMGEMDSSSSLADRRRLLSYKALPILNEWRKSRGAAEPVTFHRARFARPVRCPGGKGFRWNEEDLTMESVVFGHPGRPRVDEDPVRIFEKFETMTMGASFEEGGLRMKMGVDDESSLELPALDGKPRPADDEVVPFRNLIPLKPGTVATVEVEVLNRDQEKTGMQIYLNRVEKVVERDGVLLMEYASERQEDDGPKKSTFRYRLGDRGFQLVKITGEVNRIGDPGAFDYPAELWMGRKFRVRKEERLIQDGKGVPFLTEAVATVKGWEKVDGPKGEKVRALRIDWSFMQVVDRDLTRGTKSEWHAPGMGVVKMTREDQWGERSAKMTSFEDPG